MAEANPENSGRIRYAKQSIAVVDIFPEIMREIAKSLTTPNAMYNFVQNTPYLKEKINYDENSVLETLKTEGFDKCDTVLIYKLVRHFLPKPGQGWGKTPLKSNSFISDDIERIRIARNKIFHCPNANIPETEHLEFFQEFKDVARRIDLYLKKETFENKISDLQERSIDHELEDKYVRLAQEVEELRLRKTEKKEGKTINIYFGNDITACLESEEQDENKFKVIITGVSNVEEITDNIEELMEHINKENYVIVHNIRPGSIIVDVELLETSLESEELFCQTVSKIVYQILDRVNGNSNICVIVLRYDDLLDSDYETLVKSNQHDTELEQDPYYNPDDLILTVDIAKSALKSETTLSTTTSNLVTDILKRLSHDVPKDVDVLIKKDTHRDIPVEPRIQVKTADKSTLPYSLTLHSTIKLPGELLNIRAAEIVDNQIVFTNDMYPFCLIISTMDGRNIRRVHVKGQPFGIAVINNKTVAVSTGKYDFVQIVDISNNKITKIIKTNAVVCFGLCYKENELFVGVYGGINVYNIEGDLLRTIYVMAPYHIYVEDDRVLHSGCRTLYCSDLNGVTLWKFEQEKMSSPEGIATDKDGNVYVTSIYSHNVIVISRDGKHHREILTISDGLKHPEGICYDKSNNRLIVCNREDGKTFLFDIHNRERETDIQETSD